jgi:aryl-alcohol dehydrogenase-like predicted oxidoreductase
MDQLIRAGKILYWGTSEWNAQQITEAYRIAKEERLTPPTMEQPQYNLFERENLEKEYLPLFRDFGLGTTIWSPLASGILTGKYSNGIPSDSRVSIENFSWLKERFEDDLGKKRIGQAEELKNLIDKTLGISLAEFSIAWCLKNPNVSTVILGATKTSQLEQNLKAINSVEKITDELMSEVDALMGTRPEPAPSF